MRYLRILFVALLTMVAVLPAIAAESTPQPSAADLDAAYDAARRAPLAGAGPVLVLVEDVNKDACSDGLTTERIQTAVELRLRSAGIPIASPKQYSPSYLYINVSALKSKVVDMYSAGISVEFREPVMLKRDPKIICAQATVWTDGTILTCGVSNLPSYVCQALSGVVDKFANDYLAANPKK